LSMGGTHEILTLTLVESVVTIVAGLLGTYEA